MNAQKWDCTTYGAYLVSLKAAECTSKPFSEYWQTIPFGPSTGVVFSSTTVFYRTLPFGCFHNAINVLENPHEFLEGSRNKVTFAKSADETAELLTVLVV